MSVFVPTSGKLIVARPFSLAILLALATTVSASFRVSSSGVITAHEDTLFVSDGRNNLIALLPNSLCQVVHITKRVQVKTELNRYSSVLVSPGSFKELAKICSNLENRVTKLTVLDFINRLRYNTRYIYPGTKYCGNGNVSSGYDDLGEFKETDSCCREHDMCDDYIEGFGCHPENGLCNHAAFTRSHCKCDDRFRECLMNAKEPIAKKMGRMFFNIFGLKCFRKDYPIKKCIRRGGFLNYHCQEYELDKTKPKIYDFFDQPIFVPRRKPKPSRKQESARKHARRRGARDRSHVFNQIFRSENFF